jgi:hypothetical protein
MQRRAYGLNPHFSRWLAGWLSLACACESQRAPSPLAPSQDAGPGDAGAADAGAGDAGPVDGGAVDAGSVDAGTPLLHDRDLDDAARLLAGQPLAEGSALFELARSPELAELQKQLREGWAKYEAQTLSPVGEWARDNLKDLPPGPVFYPFSGPDLINPLTLFPRATTLTLLGLEPVGPIPRASEGAAVQVRRLKRMGRAFKHILRRNYFITDAMADGLDPDELGVAGLLPLFASILGDEVVAERLISLSPTGEVVASAGAPDGGPDVELARGVELLLRAPGGDEQVVRYFSANVDDEHFTRIEGLTAYLEAQGALTTLTKAASYLMYSPTFDDVRSLALSRSAVLVTESTGVPFHYLDRPEFVLSLYGTYSDPIPAFSDCCQPDLKAALEEHSLGPLPFAFGYEHRNHLIVARRPAGWRPGPPPYDASILRGEKTRCADDQVVVTGRIYPARKR